MKINERIKYLRKEVLHLNQTAFGRELGLAQTGVSYMEKDGSSIADNTIKAICSVYKISEEWLRNGTEPMFTRKAQFSLDHYLEDIDVSDVEKEIICTYFELEPDIRREIVSHFRSHFMCGGNDDNISLKDD